LTRHWRKLQRRRLEERLSWRTRWELRSVLTILYRSHMGRNNSKEITKMLKIIKTTKMTI
jgi:hypothetical protein